MYSRRRRRKRLRGGVQRVTTPEKVVEHKMGGRGFTSGGVELERGEGRLPLEMV